MEHLQEKKLKKMGKKSKGKQRKEDTLGMIILSLQCIDSNT